MITLLYTKQSYLQPELTTAWYVKEFGDSKADSSIEDKCKIYIHVFSISPFEPNIFIVTIK